MLIRFRMWLADLVTGGAFTQTLSILKDTQAHLKNAQTQLASSEGDVKRKLDLTLKTLQTVQGITPSQLEIYAVKAAMLYPEGKLDVSFEIQHHPGDNLKFKLESCKFLLYNYPPLPNQYIHGSGKSWEAAFDQLKAEVQAKLKYKAEQDAGVLKTDIPTTGKGVEALLSDDGKDALQAFVGGEGSTS